MPERTEAEIIRDTAIASTEPELLGDSLYAFVVPAGARMELFDIERGAALPTRPRGLVHLHTAEAFGRYVAEHVIEGHTHLYADPRQKSVVAVLNDHSSDSPGWGDHRAALELRTTREWDAWRQYDGNRLPQAQFAEFIEDHADDIQEPDGAAMRDLVTTFQASTKIEFRSAQRLDSGQVQLTYHEDTKGQGGGNGELDVPATFELGLAPFEGADAYRVVARFRYRINDGNLLLGYKLIDPDRVIEQAFEDLLDEIQSATDLEALRGDAPAVLHPGPHR